eukprot:TRINITY_DN7381_c0_g2_i2.p1 TRINITY_DN7381_c0_g2~~TRINITY_DN7381_c0_g2_i2.p1  ORF type:complete len:569 (+),score=138.08 TRINITY_DN7381_c0_g2_i2:44-1750(+)
MQNATDAKESARRKIIEKFAWPEELSKVAQFRQDTAISLEAVETQLRALVQSQLEEARQGMDILRGSVVTLKSIRGHMASVDDLYATSQKLFPEYDKIKNVEKARRNLRLTARDTDYLLHLSSRVEDAREKFNDPRKLIEVHKEVRTLEDLRIRFLRKAQANPKILAELEKFFDSVELLARDVMKKIGLILGSALEVAREDPALLVRTLRVVEAEERAKRKRGDMEVQAETTCHRTQAQEHIQQAVIEQFGRELAQYRTLEEQLRAMDFIFADLLIVQDDVAPCFPPDYAIFDFYTTAYHSCVTMFVQKIIEHQDQVTPPQIAVLYTWAVAYHRQMTNRLGIETLTPRLDKECESLLEKYVDDTRATTAQWLRTMLKMHLESMGKIEDENLVYATWSSDLFKMTRQQVDLASKINCGPLLLDVANTMRDMLKMFCESWIVKIASNLQDIGPEYMVALANSGLQCMEHTKRLVIMVEELLWDDYKSKLSMDDAVEYFLDLSKKANNGIIQLMMTDLESTFQQFFTKTWLEKKSMAVVVATLKEYLGRVRFVLNSHLFKGVCCCMESSRR